MINNFTSISVNTLLLYNRPSVINQVRDATKLFHITDLSVNFMKLQPVLPWNTLIHT